MPPRGGTAKPRLTEDTRLIRLLQLTDFHLRKAPGDTLLGVDTERSFRETLAAALADGTPPDLALLTGDLVQDACPETYMRLASLLADLPCQAWCLPGNHDDPALLARHLAGGRLHVQPQILLPDWQIICLDSTVPGSPKGRLSAAQLATLASLLEQQPERHALIALHHHPVPSGSAWMDTMQLENTGAFFEQLSRHPQVRGIVFGHIHQVLDEELNGIRLLGSPSTCFQFGPRQADFGLDAVPPGYRWIELREDGTLATVVRRLDRLPAGLDVGSAGY
ncbi:3',5'-cyclic-AMP phosphodiesterase [Methyloparacoccus murrellii]